MLKFNYIYFNTEDNKYKKEEDGYYAICVKDLKELDNVRIVSYPLDYASGMIRKIFGIHHAYRINRIINLPFKNLWYPFYFKKDFRNNKPLCFVISGCYLQGEYLRYLKRKYQNSKFVLIHRDLISQWEKRPFHYTNEEIKELFDLRLSYDKKDAENYKIPYFTEIESKIYIPKAKEYPLADVFFAGKAKDRLEKLLRIYELLTEAGLKCIYYLTGVPKNERKNLPGIIYAEKGMSYKDMLYYSYNCECILEINQENAVGYTSRFLEAIMYGKKLITDNREVKNTKFFNPQYIQCIEDVELLDTSFISNEVGKIDYHYKNEFSPIHLIEQIDKLLNPCEES